MTRTGPQRYPGADVSHWYQDDYPGDVMESNVVIWHTTEGTSLPGYSGGAVAPNFTAVPDFKGKRLRWYQHYDFDVSSRALVNARGGVETNTLNVVQVEIVGTCDPRTHAKWRSAHLYTPELPDWAVRDLAAFARWAHEQHGVPLECGVTFKAYPGSYGANGVRMSAAKWTAYRGHAGHQHVPENDHGDPGALPMAAILAAAKGATTPPPSDTPSDTAPTPADTHPARYQVTINGLRYGYGAHGDHVTEVGRALVAHGHGDAYEVGPGPTWSDADTLNYASYQRSLGYSGKAADGVPGETSLRRLLGHLPGSIPTVSLARLVKAAKSDPPKKGTPVSYAGARVVEQALAAEYLLDRDRVDGHFGSDTVEAYAKWQRRCGYSGKAADGIPGSASLSALARRHRFHVAA